MNEQLDLSVVGTAVRLHRNDEVAQYFEDGKHLISHETNLIAKSLDNFDEVVEPSQRLEVCSKFRNEGPLLMDRFDGRCLLQEFDKYVSVGEASNKNDSNVIVYPGDEEDFELLEELMIERFGTLPDYTKLFGSPKATATTGTPSSIAIVTSKEDKNVEISMDDAFILTSEEQSQLPEGIILVSASN